MRVRFMARLGRYGAFLMAASLLGVQASCSGAATLAQAPEALRPVLAALPPLPQGAADVRSASATQLLTKNGSEFEARSGNSQVQGTDLVLTAGAKSLEWAYYRFNTGEVSLLDVLATFNLDLGTQAWLGVSNYGKQRWDISGPYADDHTLALNNGQDYISPGGNFYLVFIAYDNTTLRVNSGRVRYDATVFSISGHVVDESSQYIPGSLITVQPGNLQVSVNLDTTYTVGGLVPGAYDVTPSATGFTFTPPTRHVGILGADVINVDFVGTPVAPTYTISGHVLDNASAPIAGSSVTVNPGSLSFNCDGTGNYTATGLAGTADYTVTPVASGYGFVPPFASVRINNADVPNINFTGTAQGPTYVDSVHPFVMGNCMPCHNAENADGGFIAEAYDNAQSHRSLMASQVNGDHNGSYSAVAKAMMTAWAAAGGPLGANAEHYTDLKVQIFSPICMNCHASTLTGGARSGAPIDVNWDTYAAATGFRSSGSPPPQISKRGNTRVQAGTMPPSGSLSAAQKQLFQKWIDSGWPE